MALSNWDMFAMDHNGNPTTGKFVSPLCVEVEIYKRWCDIKDKDAWVGGNYSRPEPYIMQFYEGRIRYRDVSVASLFKNYTIYLAVWSGDEENKDAGVENTFTGMVGIGTNGFSYKGEYTGVTQKHIDRLHKFLNTKSIYRYTEIDIPKTLASLDLSKGKRFNQGDRFFHDTMGYDRQCTNVGKAKEPHLIKAIKKMKV